MQCAAVRVPWRCASSGHRHQLGHGVRRSVGIGGPGRSATRDDLDVVGALLEQLPHLGAHRLLAVGLRAEVAHVPARHGDGPAADHHAGPGGEPAANALAEGESDAPLRAVLAQRGDAGVQEGARVPSGLQQQDVVVLFRDVIAEGAVARGDEVRVGVDEPRQDGGGAVVPPLHGGAVGNLDLALAADCGDAVTVDRTAAWSMGAAVPPSSRRSAVIRVKRAAAAAIAASSRALERRHDLRREALELLQNHGLRRADRLPDVDDLEAGVRCWTSISCLRDQLRRANQPRAGLDRVAQRGQVRLTARFGSADRLDLLRGEAGHEARAARTS